MLYEAGENWKASANEFNRPTTDTDDTEPPFGRRLQAGQRSSIYLHNLTHTIELAIDGCTRRRPYSPKALWVSYPFILPNTSNCGVNVCSFLPHRLFVAVVLFACVCLLPPSNAFAQAPDNSAAIKQRYTDVLHEYLRLQDDLKAPDAVVFARKNKIISTQLSQLMLRDESRAAKRGIGKVDFDFLLNAQDSPEKLDVTGIEKENDGWRLSVDNGSQGKPFVLVLINENGRWVIDDVLYPQGKGKPISLRGLLK